MKQYTLKYTVYIDVEAETYTSAKFEGADMLSESKVPMQWFFEECVNETEIEEDEE